MEAEKDKKNEAQSLDREGFFPAEDESEEQFRERIAFLKNWSGELMENSFNTPDGLEFAQDKRLGQERMIKHGQRAKDTYGILPDWVPAYYSDEGLPHLTGGMAVHFCEEEGSTWKSYFQFKSVYRNKDRWLIYSADEIVSHEMCHVARAPLRSVRYEETLAYRTSESSFRRYLGGAFVNAYDSVILLVSLFFLIALDFCYHLFDAPEIVYWFAKVPVIFVILGGLFRNLMIRSEIKNALQRLESCFSNQSEKLLFRLTDAEILTLAKDRQLDLIQWWQSIGGYRGEWLRQLFIPQTQAKES